MSDNTNNQTNVDSGSGDDEFPVAAIVCLAVAGYVILVIVILVIRHILVNKGSCQSDCCSCEEGTCCTFCASVNDACPCCCSSNVDGCLSKICGKRKRTNCIDILLCNCCGCTEGCCETTCCCTDLMPESLCLCDCRLGGCCRGDKSLTCVPICAHCCSDDLDPNTCGCLCLEVRFRKPQLGSLRRSNSAPAGSKHTRRYSTHQPPENTDSTEDRSSEKYHTPGDNDMTALSLQRDDSDTVVMKRSTSQSPTLSKSRTKGLQSGRSHKVSTSHESLDITETRNLAISGNGDPHVNFDPNILKELQSEENSLHNIKTSIGHSESLSEDSFKNLSARTLLGKSDKSTSTHESSGEFCRWGARARRSLQPGLRSQRFPNKILVSTESLSSGITVSQPGGSGKPTHLSSSRSLTALSLSNTQVNYRRPLPPLRNSVQSLT